MQERERRGGGFVIRRALASDWPALWPLLLDMGQVEPASARERAVRVMERDDHYLPIATTDTGLAGYAWAQDYVEHMRSGHRVVRLHDLFVTPRWRRKGVGATLLYAIRGWATDKGATWLQWQATHEAVPFYERLGLVGDPCPDPEHPFFEIRLTTE